MGKYKNGINGPFSGTIGNVVGANTLGIDYMRSLPEPRVDDPSPKQVKQRLVMGMISSWLRPLKAIIAVGFQVYVIGKTPINQVFSLISKNALIVTDGETKIDFEKVVLSKGVLMMSMVCEVVCQVNSLVHLKWNNFHSSLFNMDTDEATFIFYNPIKSKFATFVGAAQRIAQQVELQLPASFSGDQVHCWMQYVNVEGNQVSTSGYVGQFEVG